MPKQKTITDTYDECIASGQIRDKEGDETGRIKTMIRLADTFAESAQDLQKNLSQDSPKWSVIYALSYDALRELAGAYAKLNKKNIANHKCLFAYICCNEPELNWDFFETARTKRNGIEYYGNLATYSDFKEMKLQFQIYTAFLKKKIQDQIKE